jgi:hypothetical protein
MQSGCALEIFSTCMQKFTPVRAWGRPGRGGRSLGGINAGLMSLGTGIRSGLSEATRSLGQLGAAPGGQLGRNIAPAATRSAAKGFRSSARSSRH